MSTPKVQFTGISISDHRKSFVFKLRITSHIMSAIKNYLLEQQRFNDEVAADYTADQLFVLNDIADENEEVMRELMSPQPDTDHDHQETNSDSTAG